MKLFLYWSVIIDSYILERLRRHWHCCEWVHPGPCPKVDYFTLTPATWLWALLRAFHSWMNEWMRAFHAGGLAWLPSTWLPSTWLPSTWLAQVLLQIQSPKSQALINHIDSHPNLEQHKQQDYIQYNDTKSLFNPHSYGWVEEGQLAPNNFVGHRYV